VLLGSLGIFKLSDYFLRLHAATKASTLGVGTILVASTVHFTARDGALSLIELLTAILLFATVPVSAQMLARAAIHLRPGSVSDEQDCARETAMPGPADEVGNSPREKGL
jgi:multicomponent K+:H+ antiporter subunit G